MTDNQVVSAMFNIKTFFHMVRIVSIWDQNEYPEWLGISIIISYAQVAFGEHFES